MPLEVGIIGEGIAGLAAAIGLRRAGHNVELFETSTLKNEIGAAITISPNGSRVLDHWSFDHKRAGAVESHQVRMSDHATLETKLHLDLGHIRAKFGHGLYHYHRVDLHSGLRDLAEGEETPGTPARSITGTSVTDVDVEQGLILLEGGSCVKKDLVIIANGVKSQFVSIITGKPEPLAKNGRSAYRALIPFDRIRGKPELYKYWDNERPGFWMPFSVNPAVVFVVTYPCRDDSVLNIAIPHPTRADQEDKEDWHSPTSVDDMLIATAGFHPDIHELLRLASDVKVFTLFQRQPLDRLTRGKAFVVGDAAHVLQPTHFQGGVLALEEAAALEVLFRGVQKEDVQERLKLYNDVMLDHVQLVHLLSDSPAFAESPERERAAKISKKPLYPAMAPPVSEPVQNFFYSYNVFEEAMKCLQGVGK